MRWLLALATLAVLAGCDRSSRTAAMFADDPDSARAVVAACDAGRTRAECPAARAGLAEARRRARMAVYETAF